MDNAFSTYVLPGLIVVATIAVMEGVAMLVHRHVMHGRLGWVLHRDHHEAHDGPFELNDLYAVLFAVPPLALLFYFQDVWPLYWIGIGAMAYGIIYFMVHDGLVHQRWPFRHVPRRGYLRRLYQAHLLHHATHGRAGAVSFGFLYAPPVKALKAEMASIKRAQHRADSPSPRQPADA